MRIGIDTGGTFTDIVLWDGHTVRTHKVASTPQDFSLAVLQGLAEVRGCDRAAREFDLTHSSTVATNALLERRGARTALLTTEGFRDVLQIGRQNRPSLYNMAARRPPPLVPRRRRLGVRERVTADGRVLTPLDGAEVERLLDRLLREGVESVAVCLLFSFLRPSHERAISRAARRRGLTVSLSSEIAPEFREFERTSTTVVNAYLSPVVGRYLERLNRALTRTPLRRWRVMQSNGGSLSPRGAAVRAANTLLSGPAAGVVGAEAVARRALGSNSVQIITFDMGGTSTDVCLMDGRRRTTTEGRVGDQLVRLPMLDVHTVGAGGGSIAEVDAGGVLRVGPRSAGADPGPASYGRGDRATVTDANLLLGRIDPERFLGGRMTLDRRRAVLALDRLAATLGRDARSTARAVVRVVNSNMQRALRAISVERGHDPRCFTLVCFGGAGGLHACELAAGLGIPRILLPRHPGVLSAWGALTSDVIKDYARTVMLKLAPTSAAPLKKVLSDLERRARRDMHAEATPRSVVTLTCSLDLRYVGQSYELNVPFAGRLSDAARRFHDEHQRRFGYKQKDALLQIATARLRAVSPSRKPPGRRILAGGHSAAAAVLDRRRKVTTYDRETLRGGNVLTGPALILEPFSTTWLPPRWQGRVDAWGNILLQH